MQISPLLLLKLLPKYKLNVYSNSKLINSIDLSLYIIIT